MKGALYFEFSGKQAVVFGGGRVGLRRAKTLAGYGCEVKCVAPDNEALACSGVIFVKGTYDAAALAGADIVVAATDDAEVNQKILADCKQRKILCNASDDPEHSDFIFPAVLSRGDLDIAVTTRGASPMLARQIVKDLSEIYDESYAERMAQLKRLRRHVLETSQNDEDKRRRLSALKDKTVEELRIEVEKLCE
ncbi:MAG: bifunctional precorrin-2 dehydrogenase/sirohydrochlorin ferrochelatase [Eubacterium sp.]|nr:bifunctional precorrin-2 dehydrogenase/sirohydrochlorin ferrochelatase [Eubacterium sp.]